MTETAALFLAFAFGVMFNWLIVRWGKSGYGDGFTALWVVIGVFATLVISSLAQVSLPRLQFYWHGDLVTLTNQQHAAIYELKFFIAAGLPMFVGSLWRYLDNFTLTIDGRLD
jgi:hypothetical protein